MFDNISIDKAPVVSYQQLQSGGNGQTDVVALVLPGLEHDGARYAITLKGARVAIIDEPSSRRTPSGSSPSFRQAPTTVSW